MLDFETFRQKNLARSKGMTFQLYDWSPCDWATAFAGECGEACNLIAHRHRGDEVSVDEIVGEIADAVTYADLLCARLGIPLEEALRRKFNAVSDRVGSDIKL